MEYYATLSLVTIPYTVNHRGERRLVSEPEEPTTLFQIWTIQATFTFSDFAEVTLAPEDGSEKFRNSKAQVLNFRLRQVQRIW